MNERATYQMSLPMSGPVSPDVIERRRHVGEAIRLSMQVAMLDQKQIYIPLKFDKGHWSRIMSGELAFPADKLNALRDLTGNDIPCSGGRSAAGRACTRSRPSSSGRSGNATIGSASRPARFSISKS